MLSPVPGFAADGTARWSVRFSPKGGCTDAVVAELGKAKETVLVQAYSGSHLRRLRRLWWTPTSAA